MLVVNSGGHDSPVLSVLFSGDGKLLYSAGEDKVVRVWEAATGKIAKTLRGEIGPGPEGKIYTMALSPDSRYLAMAGVMRLRARSYIRLHDLQNKGQVFGLLDGGAPGPIMKLAYAPNGRLLASTSGRDVRVYDLNQRGQARAFQGHTDVVRSVDFSRDGARIVSASHDRTLRLWEIASGASRVLQGHTGKVVSAIFSPDGKYIASAGEDRQIRLWHADSGKFVKGLAMQDIGVANLSFSADGKSLLAGAEVYSVPDGQVSRPLAPQDGPITATALSRDGMAAVAGGSRNQIRIWNIASGAAPRILSGSGQPIYKVGFAENGEAVAFGAGPDRGLETVFYLKDGARYKPELGGEVARLGGSFRLATTSHGDLQATTAGAVLEIRKPGSDPVRIERGPSTGYRHIAYTFTADGRHVISGGFNGALSLYRVSDGQKIQDFSGHTGEILSVAVSNDNRTFVTGSNDQTLRVWDVGSPSPILNIFVASDRQWIAWIPQGYYTTNGAADKFVGWHLNRGAGSAAIWFSAAQYLEEFYKPKVVASYLETREIRSALRASQETSVNSPVTVAEKMAPLVAVKSPPSESQSSVPGNTLKLVATAQSETAPITSVKVLINKVLVVERLFADPAKTARFDETIRLEANKLNRVEVVFSNGKENLDWCEVRSGGGSAAAKPDLYVLAIGLSKYKDPDMKLDFASADAQAVVAALKTQEGIAFNEVKVRPLTDEKATKESILEGLGWLRSEGDSSDYRVIFLSGHGDIANDRYFLWCYPYDKNSKVPEILNITGEEIMSMVMQMKGRIVLMVDTCHSAAIAGAGTRGSRPDPDVVPVFKRQEVAGTIVFTFVSSGRNQKSLEHKEWGHGAFTFAVLEAFKGEAQNVGRTVNTRQLGLWLEQRVQQLTKKTQDARTIPIPPAADGFDLFHVQRQ